MYRFLGKILSALLLAAIAIGCGKGLSDKDKKELLDKGDKPLSQIDPKDKQKVEGLLIDYLADNFDYENIGTLFIMAQARPSFKDENACNEGLKQMGSLDPEVKKQLEKIPTKIKDNKDAITAHFEKTNVSAFVKCADNIKTVKDAYVPKYCSSKDALAEATLKFADSKDKSDECVTMIAAYMKFAARFVAEPGSPAGKGNGEEKGGPVGKPAVDPSKKTN